MANPIVVKQNGVDISGNVNWRDLDALQVLTKEVGTFRFVVSYGAGQVTPAVHLPVLGDVIQLYDASGLFWGGTVTEVEGNNTALRMSFRITCTDWSYLFDGTLVRESYTLQDPHDIVVDLVTNFCGGKGFTTTNVRVGGFQIPSIKFNYQQPTKCLESLARLIGWDWYIDAAKDIHFFKGSVASGVGEGGVAPIVIDQTTGDIEWNSLDVDVNLQNMKNSVFVIGSTYTKTFTPANTPDVYKTVAGTFVYMIAYPYDKTTITVTLDGVVQTVGIDQQTDPATVQVLYSDVSQFVQFTSDPGGGHEIKVYGQAIIPITAHASDSGSIATYGEYQDVIMDTKITTVPEAQARATAEVLQFGAPLAIVKVATYTSGCRIGQSVTVDLPLYNINNQTFLITRIEATIFAPGADGEMRYVLQCMSMGDSVTFVDLMTMLLQQEAAQNPVDNSTVIEDLLVLPEPIVTADPLIVTTGSGPYHWGTVTPQIRWGFWTWK